MIRYALVCDEAHEFESWFASAGAYDEQARRGFVTCPYCNSARVEKAIMAPNVARRDRDEAPAATDVGAAFPEEARKIHDGETEARPIRGQASFEDARALIEDGVDIMPIPPSPDERN